MISKIMLTMSLLISASQVMAKDIDASMGWAEHQRYGFHVNGVVAKNVIAEGSLVKAGDVLATLDLKPYHYRVKGFQAAVKKFEPAIFDAKLELDHAEELYERTVLSEVELQKIAGKYKALVAEQAIEKAHLMEAKWQLNQAELKSEDNAYVLSSNIAPGMIISDENKSGIYMELVAAGRASATAWLSRDQKIQLKSGNNITVLIDKQVVQARIQSIALQPSNQQSRPSIQSKDESLYKLVAVFNYEKLVEPGKKIKISF